MSLDLTALSSKDSSQSCRRCGEEPCGENIATPEGKKEYMNTQMCEKCFDDVTFDMSSIFDIAPEWLLDILSDDVWLAGGFLIKTVKPSHKAGDIDLFFKSQDAFDRTFKKLQEKNNIFSTSDKINSFVISGIEVQLIGLQYYDSMQNLIDDFDIHACSCAFDGVNIVKHRGFVFDNLNGFINLNPIVRPKRVLSRICKYVNKGYSLTPSATRFYTESLINMNEIPEEPDAYLSTGSWKGL